MSQRLFIPFDEDSIENEQEFNLISMTALDYLRQVRFERRKIPQVVSVTRPHNSNLNDAVNVTDGNLKVTITIENYLIFIYNIFIFIYRHFKNLTPKKQQKNGEIYGKRGFVKRNEK